ncbi:MAG: selenium-dependent molybdenum cofactor biosynthesis protein YqeB [Dehalococcoidales bacterium]|nr:selenium-dependent molybdenum cofactor biosynthesis protein YqeB [Dehalococcoidales bacterium]
MSVKEIKVLIRGGGELASGVAHRLHQSHFRVCLTEAPLPLAVRRGVAFCEAVYDGEKVIEGVTARFITSPDKVNETWQDGVIPLLIDPENNARNTIKPDVLIDAIIAKKNLGTRITDAPLVIALGPGFTAGKDAHVVIETNRGHNLGRIIRHGEAEPNTGRPGAIGGFDRERVWHAPASGIFTTQKKIGDIVAANETVAFIGEVPVKTEISGIIRGLLRDKTEVPKGMKLGDIDPRGIEEYCYTISDKSRTISGGVLEAIMMRFNKNSKI